MGTGGGRDEYVQALDRGLAVLRSFDEERPQQSIADIARHTGLTRATARRFLHTLERLGYIGSSNGRFYLRPRVLELGYAYLSSATFAEIAQEHLVGLAEKLHESCSASVLDDDDIVYVSRAQTNRIMTVALSVGSRLPAYATSMGRILLANLPAEDRDAYLARVELKPLTEWTVVNRRKLRTILAQAARDGYAVIDQELELGVRSVAAPVHNASGQVIAAINASAHASRVSIEQMHKEFALMLTQTAREIDADLAVRRH